MKKVPPDNCDQPWDCPKTQYGASRHKLNKDCGPVEKAVFTTFTGMGATDKPVFGLTRVCVGLFKPITGKMNGV